MLGLDQEFVPALASRNIHVREKLYKESPVMYNYVLAAYRLGDCIGDYKYTSEQHRHKWMQVEKGTGRVAGSSDEQRNFYTAQPGISDRVRLSGTEE